jgi:nucleoside-diphosphate-sugar epimerase
MTVLLAGCGDLGTEIGLRFAARGHRVVGLRRRAALLPAAIEGLSVDLSVDRPLVPRDTDIVVVALSAARPTPDAYRAAYVEGLRNVLDGVEAAGASPSRFLLVSSTAVYDISDGSWFDEATPAAGGSGTGAVLLEAERLLRSRVPSGVVFRLGGIYGPGRNLLLNQVRSGTATNAGRSRHTNRIHRDDAAAAVVNLMLREEPPAPLYLGVDSEPATRGEVLDFLAAELGAPAPAPAATGAAEASTRGGDKRGRNGLLLSTGFRFRYPGYRDGYRMILAGTGIRHP